MPTRSLGLPCIPKGDLGTRRRLEICNLPSPPPPPPPPPPPGGRDRAGPRPRPPPEKCHPPPPPPPPPLRHGQQADCHCESLHYLCVCHSHLHCKCGSRDIDQKARSTAGDNGSIVALLLGHKKRVVLWRWHSHCHNHGSGGIQYGVCTWLRKKTSRSACTALRIEPASVLDTSFATAAWTYTCSSD